MESIIWGDRPPFSGMKPGASSLHAKQSARQEMAGQSTVYLISRVRRSPPRRVPAQLYGSDQSPAPPPLRHSMIMRKRRNTLVVDDSVRAIQSGGLMSCLDPSTRTEQYDHAGLMVPYRHEIVNAAGTESRSAHSGAAREREVAIHEEINNLVHRDEQRCHGVSPNFVMSTVPPSSLVAGPV